MITLQTEKVSVFDVQDQADNIITETKEDDAVKELEEAEVEVVEGKAVTDEEMQEENDALTEEEKESISSEDDEEVVFEPKHVEMEEGDMPL